MASSAARSPTKASASSSQAYNAARRLGAMQGLAGMSSTNLALGAVGESSTSSNLTGYNGEIGFCHSFFWLAVADTLDSHLDAAQQP